MPTTPGCFIHAGVFFSKTSVMLILFFAMRKLSVEAMLLTLVRQRNTNTNATKKYFIFLNQKGDVKLVALVINISTDYGVPSAVPATTSTFNALSTSPIGFAIVAFELPAKSKPVGLPFASQISEPESPAALNVVEEM